MEIEKPLESVGKEMMKKIVALFLVGVMSLSLVACGGTESTSENSGNFLKKEKEIEITADNWQEYFEEKDVLSVKYNSFDEIENIYFDTILTLKEGISVDPHKSDIAVEANVRYEQYYVNIDTDTWEFNFEEKKGDFEYSSSEIKDFSSNTYKQGDNEKTYYSARFCRYGDDTVMTDMETERTYVERIFIDEIVRIKGTLYITEE